MRLLVSLLALAAAALATAAAPAIAREGPPARADTRPVMFVGNNWDGTADIVDAKTFQRLGRINTIPDKEQRLAEINSNPQRLAFFLAIRQAVGEGNDQFTDDMFTSHDGRFVYVSRPSFADVVGIELATGRIVWRFPMQGQRSDHMGISPDGTKLLVSDSTANKVHELDTATGTKTGEFPSGDSPHENNYSGDGKLIYHASIGRVYTPTDNPMLGLLRDTSKGERYFQVVDGDSLAVLKRWDIGQKLEEVGHPEMESAVRPMAVAPDERYVYMQISFHHGFVEYDLQQEKVLRIANLPLSQEAANTPPEEYLLDSAHHGLAINHEGTKLCAAGTMSDYAAIVSRETFVPRIFQVGKKPYWSTNDHDSEHCWVSVSGDDQVVVLDYAREREVARIPVGDHPQRVRAGAINRELIADLPPPPPTTRKECPASPRASVSRGSLRASRRGIGLSGRAVAFQCVDGENQRGQVRRVEVSLAHQVGGRCRYLGRRGLGGRRDCGAAVYLPARLGRVRNGKVPWTFRSRARLPRGRYIVTVRAVDANSRTSPSRAGRHELKRFSIR